MKSLLEVRDLNKSFGGVVAAVDINLSIAERELVAIIGANGAGKTTFVNMTTGYLPPSSGSIRFSGRELCGLPPRRIRQAGISRSFQTAQLFVELSALENAMFSLAAARLGPASFYRPLRNEATRERAMAALNDFGIARYADTPVSELAQGVRKLLDIAMAMVNPPRLLLLDEPTSGVAIEEKFDLMGTVMNGVESSGAAILFIEHDMDIVSRYANRVIAFYAGKVIADGPTAEALANPDVRELVIGTETPVAAAGADHA